MPDLYPPTSERRVAVMMSMYASHADEGFVLTKYWPDRGSRTHPLLFDEYCRAPNMEKFAQEIKSIKSAGGSLLEVRLRAPSEDDLKKCSPVIIDGNPVVVKVGIEYLNFDQPAVWKSSYAASRCAQERPSLSAEEQVTLVRLLTK